MRVMVLIKSDKNSETGIPLTKETKETFAAMGKFNEELVKAGVILAGEGLQPSSKGKRVRFSGKERKVIDGPFPETKELIGGFWLWQVKSMDEAVEWLKRAPFDGGAEVEIRQVYEASDFPAEVFPPEDAAREQELRDGLQKPRSGSRGTPRPGNRLYEMSISETVVRRVSRAGVHNRSGESGKIPPGSTIPK